MSAAQSGRASLFFLGRDVDASREFYDVALGWSSRPGDGGNATPPPTFVDAGASGSRGANCWVPCFAVPDSGAARDRVLQWGGEPAGEVPGSDGCSLYTAPEGALFALSGTAPPRSATGRPGEVGFLDVYSSGARRAVDSLVDVLGLRVSDEPIVGPGDYRLLLSDGGPVAGVVDMTAVLPTAAASYWVPYVRVLDLDDAVARLVDLGARVRVPVTDSSLGPFAVLADPEGIAFGLQTPVSDRLLEDHVPTRR